MVLHIVEAGQTLYSIARQYGVSPERLRTNNGIGPEAQLTVGQCVAVLFPQVTHVVRPGETQQQVSLFQEEDRASRERQLRLEQAMDRIRGKYGRDAISTGRLMERHEDGAHAPE